MKSNYRTHVLIYIVLAITFGLSKNSNSQTCVYQWMEQSSGISTQLGSVSAVSDLVGWTSGINATVRRTIDGSTWTNANPNPGVITGDVHCIAGIDANTALCVTYPSEANIYKTIDGGNTWVRVYTSTQTAIHSIQMVSSTEGYALGDPHPVGQKWLILKTIDGGNTWSRIATEPQSVNSLEASYDNSFYVSGNDIWFGTNDTRVYHSSDLGLTWSNATTPGTVNTYSVHYNNPMMGLAGGNFNGGNAIVRSIDGGTTYTTANAPPPGGVIVGIEGFNNGWWIIRSNIDVLYSSDQGSTWSPVFSQLTGYFQHLDFTIVNGCPTGWAVGNAGEIAKMSSIVTAVNNNSEVPASYSLNQNYPNPFNPSTNIKFSIPKSGFVTLKIYNESGQEIDRLVNEVKNAGNYVIGFNAANLSSGVYFYKLEADNFTDTKKMIIMK